jgi:MscS family membrane protein
MCRLLSTWQFALALLISLPLRAEAQAQEEDVHATPRTLVQAFLRAAGKGQYGEAAQLAFPKLATGPGFDDPVRTARQLKAVLDNYLDVDLDQISDHPNGRLDDRLGQEVEEIGRIPVPDSRTESVRLAKYAGVGWLFSTSTLNRVPGWYDRLPDHWLREHLPEPLFRAGPRGILWWQWLALPLLLLASLIIGRLLAAAAHLIVSLIFKAGVNEHFIERLVGPFTLVLSVVIARGTLILLILTGPAEQFFDAFLSALLLLAVFWAALRTVDFGIEWLRGTVFAKGRPERLALLPLFSKTAKIGIGLFAIVAALQKLGYPAASLIAGLGIGGLAFALAAQKTIENLFGSVILGVDQPFRPGDVVKIDDLIGTVEVVGLRSTRIRTPERTMVTLPNGRLADMRIETFAARDRIRLYLVVGLVYSTTAEQMRRIVEEITELLKTYPNMYLEDPPQVFFTNFGASSLDLEIVAWVNTKDFTQFKIARQEIFLRMMEIVERNGSRFAIPSRTVYLEPKEGETKAG